MKNNGSILFFIVAALCAGVFYVVDYISQYSEIRDVRKQGLTSEYFKYLGKHKDGHYAEEAKDSIVAISRRTADNDAVFHNFNSLIDGRHDAIIAEILYSRAKAENTKTGWETYVNRMPPTYLWDAKAKLDSINEIPWKKDETAWAVVKGNESLDNLNKYLSLYPKGKYKKAAEKKIIDIEVANDFAGDHGEMPQMVQTGYTNSSYSSIKMGNLTEYELTILCSGKADSKKLTIKSGGYKSMTLPNGSYIISVRANAPRVVPLVETYTLKGQEFGLNFYISSKKNN